MKAFDMKLSHVTDREIAMEEFRNDVAILNDDIRKSEKKQARALLFNFFKNADPITLLRFSYYIDFQNDFLKIVITDKIRGKFFGMLK
jgi:hypothetical protein